ncbi:hypothetical protein DWV89_09795 [Streptococcus pasteurianus]|nr:hypothetical protein DWV89_09795 [Streptococcus pasteurianus]
MECRISNSYSSDNFPYSDAKLEATNKPIKRNVLVTGTLTTLKKHIYFILNIKKARTSFVLARV